jgi:hypothetical protein
MAYLLSADGRSKKAGKPQPVTTMDMAGKKQVGKNGHPRKELNILECPADSDPDQLVWVAMGDILPVEEDLSLLRSIKSCDAVEQTGLPCTVGTDNREQFAGPDRKINIAQGYDPAEMERNPPNFQFSLLCVPIDSPGTPSCLFLVLPRPMLKAPPIGRGFSKRMVCYFLRLIFSFPGT